MRNWVITLAVLAAIPAWGDTRFRVARMTRNDVPPGKGQCDIRLQVDNEVEVSVRRDMVEIRTLSGQDARDDGSECNFPLPDSDVRGFNFQVVESRNEIRMAEPPSRRNDFAVIVRIRDSAGGVGRYHFRLTWDAVPGTEARRDDGGRRNDRPLDLERRGPEGFAWNNVVNFRGHGQGESRLNEGYIQHLADVSVDIDRGAKIVVSFLTDRMRNGERPRQVVFTGTVIGREDSRLKADMLSDDRRLRGTMMLSVDDRQNVNSITMDATDGRDHLHLTWDRR
jgi:hypothetical protein